MPGGTSGFPGRIVGDGEIEARKFSSKNRKYTYEAFDSLPSFSAALGNGAAVGTTGAINQIRTQSGVYEAVILGLGQTIIVPVFDAVTGLGLNIAQDQVSTEGTEISFTPNIVTSGGGRAKHGFIVGGTGSETRPFFAQITVRPGDSSGIAEGFFGFIKMEAYATALASYTEYAGISLVGSGVTAQIRLKTRLASGTAGDVDTTQTVADALSCTYRVEVDPVTRKVRFRFGTGLTQAQIDRGDVPFPTVTKSDFAFTSGVILRPAFFFLNGADLVDTLYLQNFQCGYIPQRGV